MFILLQSETETFRAWLRKVIKKDKNLMISEKKVRAKQLAKLLKISEAALTSYHSGRKNLNGKRSFPKIPIRIQHEILRLTGTSREEMLKIGENELNPSLNSGRLISITDTQIDRRISPENIQKLAQLRRRALEFDDQALGTELVRSLIEIEKMDATTLKEVQDVLQVKLKYLMSKKESESRHQKKSSAS
jgi:hypothetical protein